MDEEYYLIAKLKYEEKINPHKTPQHSDPKLFDIDDKFVESAQNRYRKLQKENYEKLETETIQKQLFWTDVLRGPYGVRREVAKLHLEECEEELRKIRNRIRYLSTPKKDLQKIDIGFVKQVPMDQLYEILPTGFFVHNPLRKERSPSNSLHWNKNTNKWTDFGSGEHGDIIDMVMKERKCNLPDACKIIIGY